MKLKDLFTPVKKLPFKVMMTDPASQFGMEQVTNPYSGESCELPRYAVAVYDTIKEAELAEDYDIVRKGIHWFQVHFTEQYYTLLD